jgi:hypothetical protein
MANEPPGNGEGWEWTRRKTTTLGTLRLRGFVNDWLFLSAGYGIRNIYDHHNPFIPKVSTVNGERQVYNAPGYSIFNRTEGFTLGVGAQWQRRHFTFGADFLGAYVPIRSVSASASDQAHMDEAHSYDRRPSPVLLGATFGIIY